MDERRNNYHRHGDWSRHRDQQTRPPFHLQPGRSSIPFSTHLGCPSRREDAAAVTGIGEFENNFHLQRRVPVFQETNSSLTPRELYNGHWRSRICQEEEAGGTESTSGITPHSWASLFSEFRVPSLSDTRDTPMSNSTGRSVPYDDRRHDHGFLRLRDASDREGEQRVPVLLQNAGSDEIAVGTAFSHHATVVPSRNSPQAPSSQLSNPWPFGMKEDLGNNTLTSGGESGGFAGSDQGSSTAAAKRRPDLGPVMTPGWRLEAGGSRGSSPVPLPSVVYSCRPVYEPIPRLGVPRVSTDGFKGKNKLDDMSQIDLDDHEVRTGGKSQVRLDPHVEISRRGFPQPRGLDLNNIPAYPSMGNCKDFGSKRCSSASTCGGGNSQDAEPVDTDHDVQRFCDVGLYAKVGIRQSSKIENNGQNSKQTRFRNSSEADGAGPSAGFIKRSRQQPTRSSRSVHGEQTSEINRANAVKLEIMVQSCNWLQRWLHPNSRLLITSSDGKGKVGFSGLDLVHRSNSSCPETMRDEAGEEHGRRWNRFQNHLTDFPSKGFLFELSPFPTPSASAIAMVGTAGRYFRSPMPATQQMCSTMIRPSDHRKMFEVKRGQFTEPRRPS